MTGHAPVIPARCLWLYVAGGLAAQWFNVVRNVQHPQARIANESLSLAVQLPSLRDGFYRGTRFDWSGVISSLEFQGHQYYAPWYTRFVCGVHDFSYDGADIIAGSQSAITGPAEEFPQPQGYETAASGETFVKIGVGALRKPDQAPYSCYRGYEIADAGTWSVRADARAVDFEHEVADAGSGCGYRYRKTISLDAVRPQVVIQHWLWNIGRTAISCEQYNHNFLTLDRAPIGPDFVLTFPFQVQAPSAPDIAAVTGQRISFVRALANQDVASFPIMGFGTDARDYDISIENQRIGAGLRITGDRPMTRLALWSIRSVLSIEPFIDVSLAPGAGVMAWTYTYTYHSVDS